MDFLAWLFGEPLTVTAEGAAIYVAVQQSRDRAERKQRHTDQAPNREELAAVAEGEGVDGGYATLSAETRAAAAEFLRVHLRLLKTVESIRRMGAPPPFAGGLWTWPYVVSAIKSVPELGNESIVSFGVLTMVSESDALDDAARDVGLSVGDAMQRFPHGHHPSPEAIEAFREALAAAEHACGRFVAVVQTGELPDSEEKNAS